MDIKPFAFFFLYLALSVVNPPEYLSGHKVVDVALTLRPRYKAPQ